MSAAYAEAWAPANLAQAEYLIDTRRDGAAFWEQGRTEAFRLSAHYPAAVVPQAARVLDYGCGVGRVLAHVPGRVRVGVDVSADMLRLAKERVRGATFARTDGRSIPWGSESIDFLYSLLTFQHMDAADVIAVLADARRVLASGGRAFLSFSGFGAEWSPTATLGRGPLQWPGTRAGASSPSHSTLAYTPEILERLATDAGLSVLGILAENREQLDYVLLAGRT